MKKILPPGNTKYLAVWIAFPPLANWMDRLPETTTLAELNSALEKMAGQWANLSADHASRSQDDGAASVAFVSAS